MINQDLFSPEKNFSLFFQIFNLSRKSQILDQIMVFGAEYVIIFTYLLALVLAFKGTYKERRPLFLIILGAPLALILIEIIHLFVFEPRPYVTFNIEKLIDHTPDNAFPSTHTTLMAVAAFAYAFYKSKWTWLMVLLLLWVGFARIFVGVHYPIDILGGIITGFISISIVWQFKNWLRKRLTSQDEVFRA